MANLGVFDSDRPHTELLGGHIYEMPPIGTPHLLVVTPLQRAFAHTRTRNFDCSCNSPHRPGEQARSVAGVSVDLDWLLSDLPD